MVPGPSLLYRVPPHLPWLPAAGIVRAATPRLCLAALPFSFPTAAIIPNVLMAAITAQDLCEAEAWIIEKDAIAKGLIGVCEGHGKGNLSNLRSHLLVT